MDQAPKTPPPVAPIENRKSEIENPMAPPFAPAALPPLRVPLRLGRDQDAREQDCRTHPPAAPIEMTAMPAEGVIPFARTETGGPENTDSINGNGRLSTTTVITTTIDGGAMDSGTQASMRPVAEKRYPCDASRGGLATNADGDVRTTLGEHGNTPSALPLFEWTWFDVALLSIIPLLLLVALIARRRRRMT